MKFRLFAASLLLSAGIFLAFFYTHRPQLDDPELVSIGHDRFITSQLSTRSFRYLKRKGVTTLVDIRPDGEDPAQPPSARMEQLSKIYHIDFHYIPVPHENIPDNAVTALGDVLSQHPARTVLYCRSGRRAARTFALAEASRTDGPNADAICEMVRTAGFSADDLRNNINQRISLRNHPPTGQP